MNKKFNFTAAQGLGNIKGIANMYVGNAFGEAVASVEGAIDVLCALKCDKNALECIDCKNDLSCWQKCAGSQVGSCISSCF